MNEKMSFRKPRVATLVAPIDWGISFAFAHAKTLILLAIVPMLVELYQAYLQFERPMSQQEMFIMLVLNLLTSAWLLTVVGLLCFERWQGNEIQLLALVKKALVHLPKVFLSYLLLMAVIVLFAVIVPPLLVVAIFFIWAPLFCVGEIYAGKDPALGGNGAAVDEDNVLEPEMEQGLLLRKRPSLFTRKSILELGFARSMSFAGANLGVSFQLALLFWFANIVPVALVDTFLQGMGFEVLALKIIIPSLADVLVLACAVGTFILLLSREAKDEMVLGPYVDPASFCSKGKAFRVRFQGQMVSILLLVLVSSVCSWLFYEKARHLKDMPLSVNVELKEVRREDKRLVVNVRMSDAEYRFRWLEPGSFAIKLKPKSGEDSSGLVIEPKKSVDFKEGEYLRPKNLQVFLDDQTKLDSKNFVPSRRPLNLEFFFEPESVVSERGEVSLYHFSFSGKGRLLCSGHYGDSW